MRIHLITVLVAALAHSLSIPAWAQMPRGVDFHGNALPANAMARIGSVAFYHIDGNHIAYSGDGKILASGGKKIFLWDPETGRELGQFEGIRFASGSRGFALSFSP